MDPLSVTASVLQISNLLRSFPKSIYFGAFDAVGYLRLYGISGIIVWRFGTKNVWRIQAQVLGSQKDEDAIAFRNVMQDECTMTEVAVCTSYLLDERISTQPTRLGRYHCTNCYHRIIAPIP